MLARLPVVATAAGGVTDVGCSTAKPAASVPVKDAPALAAAIVARDRGPGRCRVTWPTTRWRAPNMAFSARAMAAGTLEVYRKLLAG